MGITDSENLKYLDEGEKKALEFAREAVTRGEYCCVDFAYDAGCYSGRVGLYPEITWPQSSFEKDEDGKTWNVNGCCGGGCYVIDGMKFCPYCGTKL